MTKDLSWVPQTITESLRSEFATAAKTAKKNKESSFVFEGKKYRIAENLSEATKTAKLSPKTVQHLARLEVPGVSKRNIELILTQVQAEKPLTQVHRSILKRLLPKLIALASEAPLNILDKVDGDITIEMSSAADDRDHRMAERRYGVKFTDLQKVDEAGERLFSVTGKESDIRRLLKDRWQMSDEEVDLTISDAV